jgi:hypothetical protein
LPQEYASEAAAALNNGKRKFEPDNWLPKNTVFQLSLSTFLNISGGRHVFELVNLHRWISCALSGLTVNKFGFDLA